MTDTPGTHTHDDQPVAHSHGDHCDHDHDHGLLSSAHVHDYSSLGNTPRSFRLLLLALVVQAIFLVAEVAGGLIANSLALLGDAAHMLTDVGALGLALVAARLAIRPVSKTRTWGFARVELLAAFINSVTLVAACGWILVQAARRIAHPQAVEGGTVLIIAVLGLLANLGTAWLLMRADPDDLNVRAALLHTLVDAASSVAVIAAALIVIAGGPVGADTIASIIIAFLAIRGTWVILRRSLDGLLDAAPDGLDAERVAQSLSTITCVTEVHDIHVWETGPRTIALSAHVLVQPSIGIGEAITALRERAHDDLGIDHTTFQVAHDRSRKTWQVTPRLERDELIVWAVAWVAARSPNAPAPNVIHAVQRALGDTVSTDRLAPLPIAQRALTLLTDDPALTES